MRTILYTITLVTILLTACLENEIRHDSIYKDEISNYLNQLKGISNDSQLQKINSLKDAIDYTEVEVYNLRTTEKLLIVSLNSLEGFEEAETIKAIFFFNQNEVARANIVTFNSKSHFAQHNDVILSVLNMTGEGNTYSGRISFFSPFQNLLLVNDFEEGKLKVNGIARKNESTNREGKTNGCTDWYLVTTTYYSDGSIGISEQYLFTTCECEAYRVGRVNCGGGGGSGSGGSGSSSGPLFPSSPQNNDTYEYTSKDGEYTKYKFDSQNNIWVVIERILPPIVVESEPENYPFLDIEWPVNGQTVIGTDKFIYTYDGASGNWHGLLLLGDKPINEYSTKCQGLGSIWNNYPNNEVYGYITADGKFLMTNILPTTGGEAFGTYTYNGTTYYPYPASQGAPSLTYSGIIQTSGYYLIPVVASVHTHTPCRNDGTSGVSHSVGDFDKAFAAAHPDIKHWVIGCDAIGQYDGINNSFYNIKTGSISITCKFMN